MNLTMMFTFGFQTTLVLAFNKIPRGGHSRHWQKHIHIFVQMGLSTATALHIIHTVQNNVHRGASELEHRLPDYNILFRSPSLSPF